MSLFTKNADPLALSTITPELKKARAADSAAFAIQAMLMVALLTSLPSLIPLLGISASKIALVVLALSAFSAAGSVVITIVASKTSSAFAIRVALALLILASFGLTFGPASPGNSKLPVFIICTIFYGFAVGALDATTNMQAVAIQRRYGRVILNSFHAVWSAGAIVGSLVVSLGQWAAGKMVFGPTADGDPYLYQRYMWTMVTLILLLTIVIFIISPKMLKYGHEEDETSAEVKKKFHPPMKIFAALCAAMVFFYTIDFGIQNWSAVFLTDIEHADKAIAPLGLSCYMVLGMIARIVADRLARRFGESRTLFVASIISLIGMVIVLLAKSPVVAVVGFAIVGCGVPITAPLCFSTAGYLVPMEQLDEAIGRLNLFNYIGTLLGGGVVGLISQGNMKVAMIFPLVMCVALVCLSPFFRRPTNLEAVEEGDKVDVGDIKLTNVLK